MNDAHTMTALDHHPLSTNALTPVTLVGWSEAGLPLVQFDDSERPPIEAQMLTSITDADIERAIAGRATAFAQLDDERILIVGITREPKTAARQGPNEWTVIDEEGKVVVHAAEQLELRCGEASITLRADGKIVIRGVDVTTRARRTQRIKGGTVLIN